MFDIMLVYHSKDRYNEMLAEAAEARRARANQANHSLQSRLMLGTSDLLISLGQKLKTRYQPRTQHPIYQ